jgi:hypothetical protein
MATLNTKIEQYVGRKVDFLEEVIVEFDHDGNKVIGQWNIESPSQPTDEQLDALEADANAAEDAVKLELLREERNAKLAETDWEIVMHKEKGTNIPAALKTYRQALRDITDTYTSLDDVVWPEKP